MIQQNCIRKVAKQSPKDTNQIKYGLLREVIWVTILFKKWPKDNDKEMYSTHSERKSVVAEKFIRTLKAKSTNT